MTTPDFYQQGVSPAYPLLNDAGEPDAATLILLGHTGTLRTTGEGDGDTDRTGVFYGVTVDLGADTSAAGINPYLKPDLSTLPDGYVAGPTLDGPIY